MRWIIVTWKEDCFEGDSTRNSKNKQQKKSFCWLKEPPRDQTERCATSKLQKNGGKSGVNLYFALKALRLWGMFIPLQVTLFCCHRSILYSCLYLFSSFSDPLLSFSSIIHQSLPCLALLCGPSIHVFSPHAGPQPDSKQVFFASEDVSRGSYTGRWEQMLVLLNTVNTPKAQAPLTHTETDWKTHNQTWRMLCRKSLFLLSLCEPDSLSQYVSLNIWLNHSKKIQNVTVQ